MQGESSRPEPGEGHWQDGEDSMTQCWTGGQGSDTQGSSIHVKEFRLYPVYIAHGDHADSHTLP